MKRPGSLQRRDGLGVVGLLAVSGVLYEAGGAVPATFGVVIAVVWGLGPPVFAFAIGQAALAAVVSPSDLLVVAVGEAALLGVLLSDVEVPFPVRSWLSGLLLAGPVVAATAVPQSRSLWLGAATCVCGFGGLLYGVHRYERMAVPQPEE
jgi:hypothetical protein